MANKLYEEDDIQDIADAIRAKNGSNNTYKVSQMAAAINNLPTGTTLSNGKIVQMYSGTYSSTAIPKDRFVQFNYFGATNATPANSYFSCVQIDTNKVVIAAFYFNSSQTPKSKLILTVETLENHTITSGEAIEIPIGDNNNSKYKLIKISTTEIMLINRNPNTEISCTPISINGYTLTAGESTTIISGLPTSNSSFDCEYIGSNTFVTIYDKTSSSYLWGTAFSYSNGSYTLGTETQITTATATKSYGKLRYLSDNKLLVGYSGSSNVLNCGLIEISNLSINILNTIGISGVSSAATSYDICVVSDSSAIFALPGGNITASTGAVLLLTIGQDNTLTKGSNNILNFYGYTGAAKLQLIRLAENTALVTCYDSSSSFVYGILFINGTSIQQKIGGGIHINANSANSYCPVLIDSGKIMIVSYNNSYMVKSNYLGYIELDWRISGSSTYIAEIYKRVSLPSTILSSYGEKRIDGFTLSEVGNTTLGDVYVFNA